MSGHNELLKEIEEHLEKLASAHTVLSDAIENEKRAGLVQAITKGVGAVTNFARTPVQHTTAGIGEIVHGARHSTTAQKGAVAGVGLLGAAAGGGMNREKQANALIPTTPTPEVTPKPSSERLAAVKAILEKHKVPLLVGGLTVGGLGLGYAANHYNVEKQAADSEDHSGRNAVIAGATFAAPGIVGTLNSGKKYLQARNAAQYEKDIMHDQGAAWTKKYKEDLYHQQLAEAAKRKVNVKTGLALAGGGAAIGALLGYGGTKLVSGGQDKQAEEDSGVGRYAVVGGLSGAALAAPDAVRALKSLNKQKVESKGYDAARAEVLGLNQYQNLLDITHPHHNIYKQEAQESVNKWTKHMVDHKSNYAAASDFTDHMAQSAGKKFLVGGGVGLAAVGAKQLWDANHQKQASDSDDQYSPHYVRNAVLTGGALAAPDAARAYKSTAKGLDHRETFHEHSALSKRYLAEGDLINAAKYADSANKHKALAHEADLYTHNLGGSIGKKLATGAALATAVTGVNHIMHSGTEKQASDDDHSVRNSLLVGTAAGGSQVPSWFKARKKEIVSDADLARANEIHYHNVLNREAARMDFRRHNEAGDRFESIKANDAFQEAAGRAYESQSGIDSHTILRDTAKAQKLNALKRAGVLGLGTAALSYGVQNAVSKRGQTKSASLKAILQALETC